MTTKKTTRRLMNLIYASHILRIEFTDIGKLLNNIYNDKENIESQKNNIFNKIETKNFIDAKVSSEQKRKITEALVPELEKFTKNINFDNAYTTLFDLYTKSTDKPFLKYRTNASREAFITSIANGITIDDDDFFNVDNNIQENKQKPLRLNKASEAKKKKSLKFSRPNPVVSKLQLAVNKAYNANINVKDLFLLSGYFLVDKDLYSKSKDAIYEKMQKKSPSITESYEIYSALEVFSEALEISYKKTKNAGRISSEINYFYIKAKKADAISDTIKTATFIDKTQKTR